MDRGAWQATVHRVAKSWTQMKHKHAKYFLLNPNSLKLILAKEREREESVRHKVLWMKNRKSKD